MLCLRADQPMGVERYVRNVIGAMRVPADVAVCLFLGRGVALADALGASAGPPAEEGCGALRQRPSVDVRRMATGPTLTRILVEMLWLSFAAWRRDAVLSINNFGPLFGKRGQQRFVIIHDVWFLSGHYEGRAWRRLVYSTLIRLQVRRSSHFFSPTYFSRQEIHRLLGVPLSAITVAPMCLHPVARSRPAPAGDYFLLVGSSRPNKNVLRAMNAYRVYRERGGTRRLVVAGSYSDAFTGRMWSAVGDEAGGSLEIVGYVSDARMQELLKSCAALVFVSLYEGYGIPVLEALLHGKPSLVSLGTSCEEVMQGLGVAVDGSSVEAIARGLEQVESYDTVEIIRRLDAIRAGAFDCERASSAITDVVLA